jgi:glycosyltransferase involved in cell wall biosynthesis
MHNSETVIAHTIDRWLNRLNSGNSELILVENGSSDNTWDLANSISKDTEHVKFKLIQSEKGMGNALAAGISVSTGKHVLLSADDLPFDFVDLDEVAKLSQQPPIVIGSKAHKNSTVDRGILRKTFTRGYRLARFLTLGSRVGDTQGTFIIEGDLIRRINPLLSEPGFLFTTQLVVVAEQMGVEIAEVPVSLSLDHAPKKSTVRWADVIDMSTGLIKLRKFKKTSLPGIKAT